MIGLSSARHEAIHLLRKSTSTRNVLQLASGTVVGNLLMLSVTPIVTRLYAPRDFSCLGLFLAFIGVAVVFATMKYESAIVSSDTMEDATYLLTACFVLSLPIAVAVAGILHGLRMTNVLGFALLPSGATLLVIPAIVSASAIASTRQWLVREKRFELLRNSFVARAGGRCVTQVGCGVVGGSWFGLLLAEVVARTVGCGVCLKHIWPHLSHRRREFRWSSMVQVLFRYARFPLFCLPSTLLDSLALAAPVPLMIGCFGTEAGGSFVLIQQVLRAPLALLIKSTSDVFHQRLAHLTRRGGHAEVRLIDRTVLRLFVVGLLPSVFIALTAPWLLPCVFGPQWSASGSMAAALTPWLLAQFAVAPLGQTMSVFRAYHIKLRYDVASLVATVGGIAACVLLRCSALSTVHVISWLNVLAYVFYYALVRHVAQHHGNR